MTIEGFAPGAGPAGWCKRQIALVCNELAHKFGSRRWPPQADLPPFHRSVCLGQHPVNGWRGVLYSLRGVHCTSGAVQLAEFDGHLVLNRVPVQG
jgi:hypothetical protein